jgi:hypothetical protein
LRQYFEDQNIIISHLKANHAKAYDQIQHTHDVSDLVRLIKSKLEGSIKVIIPFSFPGVGKSSVLKKAIERANKNDVLVTIDNDEIRKKLVEEYMETHKEATSNEAF